MHTIPQEFGNLYNLKYLGMERNNLIGFIPFTIYNITSLKVIALAKNNLSGSLSPHIENLTKLNTIFVSDNQLTDCQYLEELSLTNNPLDGFLPYSIGNFSESLQYIAAAGCKIKGNIPNEIGNLSNFQDLYLDYNELDSLIPTAF
ncbi:hypothetical protein Pfo_027276 [Paulownia fortunei]|nr:hypothetical protein Pfo_027276 [Paulownia fortunei]